jgi:hypothetical protein
VGEHAVLQASAQVEIGDDQRPHVAPRYP